MPTVAVTGATGFIGRHIVRVLEGMGSCRIIAVGRDEGRLQSLGVQYVVADLNIDRKEYYDLLGRPDVLIHLAWEGLPNYRELFHIERNLMASYRFLKAMIEQGLPSLTVSGTCYEYGLQSGRLTEETPAAPTTSYGIAKDCLRRFLYALREHHSFHFIWARLFFLHGEGQHSGSLIPQIDRAMESGAHSFDMSGGEQLRDYLPVADAASLLAKISLQSRFDGVFNICSGKPISVRRLAEQRVAQHESTMKLNFGVFPYPEHEPLAYWGDDSRLRRAVEASGG